MVRDINNLAQLYRLLDGGIEGQLEVSISNDLLSSLKGCLKLGIAEIIHFDPHCLPPRHGITAIPDRLRPTPTVLPDALDVIAALNTGSCNESVVVVSTALLDEGVSWIEDVCTSARLGAILSRLRTVAAASQGSEATVQREHLQELVDWLDLIMDNRPNRLAEKIRESVNASNPEGLLSKFRSSERMPWEN